MPSIPPDILTALRQATASRHARLDHAMPLAAPNPMQDDYRQHLQLLLAWLVPMRRWQSGFTDGPQDPALWLADDAPAQIAADLAHDGKHVSAMTPACRWPWPDGASAAYRWGVMYVVEGSRLGGAVLYRKLVSRLAPHPLHYLSAQDGQPGPRWQQFLATLRSEVATGAQCAEACAGACDAFDALLALLPADAGQAQAAA